jgi:hypothetical protein
MSNPKPPLPPVTPRAAGAPAGPASSLMQRTIGKSVHALESTAERLRRLQQPAERKEASGAAPGRRTPPSQNPAEPSGRVAHDSRGNAVWNWAAEAGALALESTSRLLKKLEVPELAVEDKPRGLELEERQPGGGYDPYNRARRGR